MTTAQVPLGSAVLPPLPVLSPARMMELSALKMVLCGESIVDFPRLFFSARQEVDHFLRLCAFDTDNPLDMGRLHELHHEATVYLTDVHRYRLPLKIEQPQEIHDLFLAAADISDARVSRFACMTLKVMHILHHVAGRELVFNTPISEAQLFERLNARVFAVIDQMRASGIGVHEFAAGKKSSTSLATKLLAKRDNLATHIFDKLRFRIIVGSREELISTLLYLLQHLVPFSFILPEQSHNSIVSTADLARSFACPLAVLTRFWDSSADLAPPAAVPANEFSSSLYRCINFIADIPMRIDDVAASQTPAIAFVQTEVQLMDEATARTNERGDSSHAMYKKRQRARVRSRLENLALNIESVLAQSATRN